MRKTCSLVLAVWVLAGALLAAPRPQLEITVSDHERIATYRYELDEARARELGSAKKLDEWTLKAKRDHADRFGYTKRVYGKDAWKMIAGLKVEEVQLVTARGKRALREGEMPPGNDLDSWYAPEDQPADGDPDDGED